VGPLIRKYSYRKVALLGSALSALGLIATFPAENMAHIISTYSIMGGKCLDSSCVNLTLRYVFLYNLNIPQISIVNENYGA
jgi:hypothetical protein